MKMYRGRKSCPEWPLKKNSLGIGIFYKWDSRRRDFVSSSLYPSSLDSSPSFLDSSSMLFLFPPFVTPLPRFDLSSLWYYRGFKYILALKVVRSLLQRVTVLRQSSHGHRSYLPSGINQLNARLLEASASLKPILLTFLFYLSTLFPLARRVRGEAAIRSICRLLIQLAFLPSVHTRHSGSSSPSSLTELTVCSA